MTWAASRWLLRVCPAPKLHQPTNYTYHATREEAVRALVDRETAAIATAEKDLNRHKARLRAFMRKEGITHA